MTCSACNATLVVECTLRHERSLGDKLFSARLRARRCKVCGLTTPDVFDLGAFELAVARVIAHGGEASPDELRFLRGAIGYDRVEAARALLCSPDDVASWEAGHSPIPAFTLRALRDLVLLRTAGVAWFPIQVQRARDAGPLSLPPDPLQRDSGTIERRPQRRRPHLTLRTNTR